MNMIQFKTLTLKNFLSFGNNPTVVRLDGKQVTAVLGLNHDTGGEESRNGVGKSALIDALSYVFFGKSLRGTSNAKLVNKLARKGQGMLVTLDMETPKGVYRIERGEAPSRMRLFRKELDDDNDILSRDGKNFIYDITRSKPETTRDIEQILDLDIKLFEFLVANSSETDAYMKLPEDKKRDITERLLGLNILSQRAEELKEDRKSHRKDLVSKESAQEATRQANRRIQSQIDELMQREKQWVAQQTSRMEAIKAELELMQAVDLDEQKEILTIIEQLDKEQNRLTAMKNHAVMRLREAERDLRDTQEAVRIADKENARLAADKEKLDASCCPTCQQHWVADPSYVKTISDEIGKNHGLIIEAESLAKDQQAVVDAIRQEMDGVAKKEAEHAAVVNELAEVDLKFDSLADLSAAGARMEARSAELETLAQQTNPHTETIQGLKAQALTAVDESEVKDLKTLIAHYDYLIELLQHKDSFLRKAIIDQWLPKLNGRIAHYLNIMELPFQVRIENDLSMTITDFGEDFDWGNLSKGQRQRVTVAMNLSFQDLYEATNQPLSLLLVDELLDNGLCSRGAERALEAIKSSVGAKEKSVFLITHRADIADRVDDTLYVEMRNRQSFIEADEEEDVSED